MGEWNMSQSTGETADPLFQLAFASLAPLFMDGAKIKMFHHSKEYTFQGWTPALRQNRDAYFVPNIVT